MVITDHIVPYKTTNTRQTVPYESGAEMPDMHWLGHIRRTKVNDDPTRTLCQLDTQTRIFQKSTETFRIGRGIYAKIKKPRPCNLHLSNITNLD